MARFQYSALLLFALLSCDRSAGCGQRPLAELLKARGEVSRDHRGHERDWGPAEVGSEFAYGDALRTAKGSIAEVRVGKSGRVLVESETIIRFLDHLLPGQKSQGSGLQVTQGSATVEAETNALTLQTRGGTAVLQPGTKIVLKPAAETDSYRVLMGSVTFHQADGQTIAVGAGHTINIGIGLAVLDEDSAGAKRAGAQLAAASPQPDRVPDAAVVAPRADAGQDAGGARDVAVTPDASQAEQAEEDSDDSDDGDNEQGPHANIAEPPPPKPSPDVTAPAGESFQVYDPRPPTRVGISVPARCKNGAELRAGGARPVRGTDEVLDVKLWPGVHRYALYCLRRHGRRGRRVATGRIRVRRATGTRPLPRTAPHNAVDLDGHRYRLMYQNLRPVIDVAWPSAPKAPGYTLILTRGTRKKRRLEIREPKTTLRSDVLRDGKQVLVMQAHNAAGTRSKPTTLDLRFDNAVPTVSLALPPVAGFAASRPIRVRGTATAGTKVSVEGRRIRLNRRGIFRYRLKARPGRSALSVRFQHRAHGVRYYVRRVRRSAR